jgi:Acyl-CoA thioesterase C-terminal domain
VRPGRRVQELAGEVRAEGELICRASALRVQPVPEGLEPASGAAAEAERAPAMPGPRDGSAARFALDDTDRESFAASAMEMRWLNDPWSLGPGRVWMRLRHPLVAGQQLSSLARLAATADFSNGVSAELPFDRFIFINADLHVHLLREPRGEWIGLDARTLLHGGGSGVSESVLHDEHGVVGRAFQTLVVQPR